MVKIISLQLSILNFISKSIFKLRCFFIRFLPKDKDPSPVSDPYRYFQVDQPPDIHKQHTPITFEQAEAEYFERKGKDLTPVKRRKGSAIPKKTSCPRCGAPHDYTHDNNGKATQFQCKAYD